MIEHKQLGPIDITCDTPPYFVVRACQLIGFERPEDVRWRRLDEPEHAAGWRGLWQRWFGGGSRGRIFCTCGELFPSIETFTFTFVMNRSFSYHLGQCSCCRSVFWKDA